MWSKDCFQKAQFNNDNTNQTRVFKQNEPPSFISDYSGLKPRGQPSYLPYRSSTDDIDDRVGHNVFDRMNPVRQPSPINEEVNRNTVTITTKDDAVRQVSMHVPLSNQSPGPVEPPSSYTPYWSAIPLVLWILVLWILVNP